MLLTPTLQRRRSPANAALALALAILIPGVDAEARDETLYRDLTPEQRPMAEIEAPRSDLEVRIWTDRRNATYRPGESVTLFVEASKDAYVTILDVGTSGRTHVVFPNKLQPDNRLRGGQVIAIPGEDARWRLKVSGPAGRELVKVFASEQPLTLYRDEDVQASGPFRTYRRQGEALTRDLSVELQRPRTSAVATASTSFRIARPKVGGRPDGRPSRPGSDRKESPEELFLRAEAHWYGETGNATPNVHEALRWYKAAAEAGHVQAMLRIGRLHEDGQELDRNLRLARNWYQRAAERGNTQAMVRLARMHALGIGTDKNIDGAIGWLGKAVEQGDGMAMQTLARLHDEGPGDIRDRRATADLVIRALKAGAWTTLDMVGKLSLEARKAVQRALAEARVYEGPIDGVIGTGTRRALQQIARQA